MRCIWLLCLSISLCAQTIDLSNLGTGTVSLAGQWKFHPGDDPRWADPNFDDSGWGLVAVPLNLADQGYSNFSGYGWYRLKLHRDPKRESTDLSIATTGAAWAAEFFAGGARIGSFGRLPPHARLYLDRPMSFDIPKDRWENSQDLVLAVRIWVDPKLVGINKSGFLREEANDLSSPRIGLSPTVKDLVDARKRRIELQRLPAELAKCAELVLALYLIGLFFTETKRLEYLILGLNFTGDVLSGLLYWLGESSFLLTIHVLLFFWFIMPPLLFASGVYGMWALFECRVNRFLHWSLIFYLLLNLALYSDVYLGFWKLTNFNMPSGVFASAFCCILAAFLLRRTWTTSGELRWLALSFIPFFIALFITGLTPHTPGFSYYFDPFYLFCSTTMLCAVMAFGFLLMRRSGRARAEQDRLHAEMEAARQVQRLMLPAQCVDASYVHIDTAYLPSQEVGGDFYQIATGEDGSVLLIIGDVSGKGLQAALTMSLIVGLWQEVVSTVQSPCEILCRFNHYLQRRLSGGFVTCLCARLKPDGQLTIANAGHLAPYLNGTELAVLNGLPLGISEESEYEESHHFLSPTDTLVLISDGVVEARDKKRSFYGFERLQQALSEHPGAEMIARRAQQFGQEDDITVIALSPRVVTAESTTAQAAFAVQH